MYNILVLCLLFRLMASSSDNITTDFQPSNDVPERRARDGDYIGCYPHSCLDVDYHEVLSDTSTPDTCTATCKENGFHIAALYNITECACSCEQRCLTKQLPDTHCGLPCRPDLESLCGGFAEASYYVVKSVNASKSKCSGTTTGGMDGLSPVDPPVVSVHIAIPIFIPVAISLIIIVVGILTYNHLSKHTRESTIRVTERANERHRGTGRRDKIASGSNPSVKNPRETLVGEVLYEEPDKNVSSATTADPKLSHEYLVQFKDVPLKNSSSDHDYNYPDMPDVGLVRAPVSARSTDEEGYIDMDRDPQGRTTAGSKVYYSSRIPRSQGGMGSSEIPGSEGYNSTRIPKLLIKEERGGSIENPESHVYYSAGSVNACNDNEDGAYIILDEN